METCEHPSVVIVADGELARKGFEYYARAAGMRVGPFGAPAKLVLRGGGGGGDVDAPMHVVVDAQGICIEPRRDPDQATIATTMRLIGCCLPAGSTPMTEKSERGSVPTESVSVLIVVDHPIFREGLAQTVADHADLHLIGTASSVERIEWRALAAAESLVVLLDLNLPGKAGAAAVAYVVQTGARVVVVSAEESRDTVLDALAARGYVTKSSEIHHAIRTVAAGDTFVSATLASDLLTTARPDPEEQLTPQEQPVLTLLAGGELDQDIADHLGITVRTVRSHLERIRDKTGRRRVELAQLAHDTNPRP